MRLVSSGVNVQRDTAWMPHEHRALVRTMPEFKFHFKFSSSTYENADIDECAEGTSGCSQQCNNTIGSFECSCVDGYRLALDGKICNGMHVYATYGGVSLSTSNICAHGSLKKPSQRSKVNERIPMT